MFFNKIKFIFNSLKSLIISFKLMPNFYEIELEKHYVSRRKDSKNPFFSSIKRYSLFSQSDEDSIIDEVIKRLEIQKGSFLELGVGNGLQNNTLNLLSKSWEGIWVGAEDLVFEEGSRLKFFKKWITKDNIVDFLKSCNKNINKKFELDLISIDLDGNDYHIWEAILNYGVHPKIIVAEYNGIFGPEAEWIMPYEEKFNWKLSRSMYFGASYKSLINLFKTFNYLPVCCNSDTGVNLFLVEEKFRDRFPEILATDERLIYESPNYSISSNYKLHKSSPRLAASLSGRYNFK